MTAPVRRVVWPRLEEGAPESLVGLEWLVTNGLGGYASGTVSGVATRRYHGLLVAAHPAPLGRVMMVNHLREFLRLPDYRTRTGFRVTPVIGLVTPPLEVGSRTIRATTAADDDVCTAACRDIHFDRITVTEEPMAHHRAAMALRTSIDAAEGADRSRERRAVLAKAVTKLFDFWELGVPDRLTLLGLASGNRMTLQRYAHGEPVAASRDTLDRIGHLLGIQKSLELLYPRNVEIQKGWMTSPNRLFHDRRPVDVVESYGLPGLVMVRGTLDIMRGLAAIAKVKGVDVVIVGRGGGSIEDLWALNEEVVARAISECSMPVVTGIGHETDFSIADFVADLRAPTPTAAAAAVAPDRAEPGERVSTPTGPLWSAASATSAAASPSPKWAPSCRYWSRPISWACRLATSCDRRREMIDGRACCPRMMAGARKADAPARNVRRLIRALT